MKPDEILEYCLENLEGVYLWRAGEKRDFFRKKDGDNDKGSKLDRSGVYRGNLGVRKSTFIKLFESLKPYIQEAYGYAKEKFARHK